MFIVQKLFGYVLNKNVLTLIYEKTIAFMMFVKISTHRILSQFFCFWEIYQFEWTKFEYHGWNAFWHEFYEHQVDALADEFFHIISKLFIQDTQVYWKGMLTVQSINVKLMH